MNLEVTVRQATPSDIPKLKEIIDLSFPRFFRFFASHSVNSEEGKVLVSESQGAVVGFAKLIEFKVGGCKYGCVLWLAVHHKHRRKGVASALVKAGTENLKQDSSEAVFASVNRRNVASLRVLGLQGFKRIGLLDLWRLFSWRVFEFYGDIWYSPTEVVLTHD
jgi:N-acetylglutamate synthase-like GNAT family acetyltransferase